eukprot:1275602-Amphidinium_carterae.1
MLRPFAALLTYQCCRTPPGGFLMCVNTTSASTDAPMCSLWRPRTVSPWSQCRAALCGSWSQHHGSLTLAHHANFYCRDATADRNSASK